MTDNGFGPFSLALTKRFLCLKSYGIHNYMQVGMRFLETSLSIQLPLAAIEIVFWDSSLTLFFSKQASFVGDFLRFFPLSEDILTYNLSLNNP